tara:strand:+ start:17793 stop:18275 length:483 start_codon:yes stop_codon:yes gene_type:complete
MALGKYKPGALGAIGAEKRDKRDTLQQFKTLQTDPRSLGLTDAEREREAFTARRAGGAEAEAQSRAQTLGLSKQLEQQKADQIRARMTRRADIARQKAKEGLKTAAQAGMIVAGAATGQPGLALEGVRGMAGIENAPSTQDTLKKKGATASGLLSGMGGS